MLDVAVSDDRKAYIVHDEPEECRIVEMRVAVGTGEATILYEDGAVRRFASRLPRSVLDDIQEAVRLIVVPLTRQVTCRSYLATLVLEGGAEVEVGLGNFRRF